ncbi:hypothetical protein PPL_02587 [Heterostelium album PN500]|uniref:Ankyrin repeat-containing protein n=1 Tax=Heterostelium pallidum (strain ATCC 26659 / Pp 5 / PN500) TaxID=670386 RepID=D3B2H4_HETP5|nr:hypothetical protein PPL_02587 [Heterostelium album PN500]EFA83522.1 hypothetical protein PPL_02587 [Heterostelium album PN500]|eukprot:XP_020435639.1 hypothetical protein PPL_02587 [Heterostelium album PN500]
MYLIHIVRFSHTLKELLQQKKTTRSQILIFFSVAEWNQLMFSKIINNIVLSKLIFDQVHYISKLNSEKSYKWNEVLKKQPQILASHGYYDDIKQYLGDRKNCRFRLFNDELVFVIIKQGSLQMFELVMEYQQPTKKKDYLNRLLQRAARYGRLDICQYLLDEFPSYRWNYYEAIQLTPLSNSREVLEFLESKTDRSMLGHELQTLNCAAGCGSLEMIKWLIATRSPPLTSSDMLNQAIIGNQMEVLKYLIDEHSQLLNLDNTSYLVNAAGSSQRFEIFKMLYDYGCKCPENVANVAACSGNLVLIQWLIANTSCEINGKSLEMAAEYGHLNLVKWLVSNHLQPDVGSQLPVNIMNRVALRGHLDTLVWLENNTSHRIDDILDIANRVLYLGFPNMIQYLCEMIDREASKTTTSTTSTSTTENRFTFTGLLEIAVMSCDLNIAKWAYTFYSDSDNTIAIEGRLEEKIIHALTRDKVKMIDWLYTNVTEHRGWLNKWQKYIKTVVQLNSYESLEWLLDRITLPAEYQQELLSQKETSDHKSDDSCWFNQWRDQINLKYNIKAIEVENINNNNKDNNYKLRHKLKKKKYIKEKKNQLLLLNETIDEWQQLVRQNEIDNQNRIELNNVKSNSNNNNHNSNKNKQNNIENSENNSSTLSISSTLKLLRNKPISNQTTSEHVEKEKVDQYNQQFYNKSYLSFNGLVETAGAVHTEIVSTDITIVTNHRLVYAAHRSFTAIGCTLIVVIAILQFEYTPGCIVTVINGTSRPVVTNHRLIKAAFSFIAKVFCTSQTVFTTQ